MSRVAALVVAGALLLNIGFVLAQLGEEKDALVVSIDAEQLPAHARLRLGRFGGYRCTAACSDAAMSLDGTRLAVVSTQGDAIGIIDVATGKMLQQLEVQARVIGGRLEFSTDGSTLAFQDFQDLRVWDVASGKLQRQIPQRNVGSGQERGPSLSKDGRILAVSCRPDAKKHEEEIRVFGATGALVGAFQGIHNLNIGVAVAPDGKTMASWGFSRLDTLPAGKSPNSWRVLQIWDIGAGKELRQIKVGGDSKEARAIYAVAYSPDGKTVTAVNSSSTYHLIDIETGKETNRFSGSTSLSNLCAVRFSPGGEILAGYDHIGVVQAWDVKTGQRLDVAKGPQAQFKGVAFPGENRIVAVGRMGRSLHWWNAVSGTTDSFAGHRTSISALTFSRDGKSVVTLGHDRDLIWWDAATGAEQRRLPSIETDASYQGVPRNDFALSPNGHYVANLSHGRGGLKLWNASSGRLEWDIPGPKGSLKNHIAFSPDSSKIAVSGGPDPLRIWDIATGKELPKIAAGASGAAAVNIRNSRIAFAPNGKIVAVHANYLAKGDGPAAELILWDIVQGQNLYQSDRSARLSAANIATGSMAFSSEGRYLAFSEEGGAIVLLSGITGKEIRQLISNKRFSTCQLAFSPDRRFLAVGNSSPNLAKGGKANDPGDEAIIEIWELISGQVREYFRGHTGPITCLAFSPDGATLASGSADRTVLLWDFADQGSAKSDLKHPPLAAGELPDAWKTLTGYDPNVAITIRRMVHAPAPTMAFLKQQFQPARKETPGDEAPDKLVADLDSNVFKVRDAASKKLARLGDRALPALKQSLDGNPTLETRRRVLALVDAISNPQITPADLQATRGVEVLERIGNAEARDLLTALAQGDPLSRTTQEAAAALARLKRK